MSQGLGDFLDKPIGGGIFAQITYRLAMEIGLALAVGIILGGMVPAADEPAAPQNQMIQESYQYTYTPPQCPEPCRYQAPQCPKIISNTTAL